MSISNRAWGPSNAICDSCHETELLLHTVEFSDGALFHVCGRCAEVAHRLGLEVLA